MNKEQFIKLAVQSGYGSEETARKYTEENDNQVSENFGLQIGSVPSNYANGYMQAIRDCKAPFHKDDSSQVGKIVVNAGKKQMIGECINHRCAYGECDECEFFNPKDSTDGDYFCAIRDDMGNIPYYREWDMESALGEKVE